MKIQKKIRLAVILAFAVSAAGYAAYVLFHYYFYMEYKKCLADYSYEEGREFAPLADDKPCVDGMVLAAENDYLKLYTNTSTTEIAVYDKRTGQTTYSNPVDRADDPIASGRNKIALNSQFALTYYDATMTQTTMYNYDYSVERKQFKIEAIENGIRYIYLLGNLESPTGLVPPYITMERLEEKVLSKLDKRDSRTVKSNYIKSETLDGFMELTTGIQSSKIGMEKMNKLFEKAGYTWDDFDYDARMAAGGKLPEKTTFSVPLEYRLVDDKLELSVPTGHIVETGSGKLAQMDLLCFFGAGGADDEGYFLVPNGSGSLIYFNNGKKAERYNQYIYGMDESLQSYTVVENAMKARIPVFGIKHGRYAIFAEIVNGDALANIIADTSGKINSYNYIYPSFLLRSSEKVSMFGVTGVSSDLPVLEKDMYDLKITVTYAFLEEKDAGYPAMANYYRDELIKRGVLARKGKDNSIPFYMDIVGGVKLQKSILGAPYMGVHPMTAFEEAEKIIDDFMGKGVSNLRVNYLGWFNGGYYHDAPTHIKVERKLGGKKGLERLDEKLETASLKLYGDVAFQKVSYAADNFNWKMESSKYYSGYVVSLGRVNPATLRQTGGLGYMETNYDILSPKFLVRHVDKFRDEIKNIDIYGISLRDLGDTLVADRRRTGVINRQEARQVVEKQLELLAGIKDGIMIKGGNAYSWAYATDLQDVPEGHNPFYIVDEEVPFYQMVIHGCIDYAGSAVNLSGRFDKRETVLRLVEYGSSPHFVVSCRDSSEIKYSGLNSFFSTQYGIWLEDAAEIYRETDEILKYVTGSFITDHQIIMPGLRKITYDNGCAIYINLNDSDITLDNMTIPAKGCKLEGIKE